jgi:hypothetical protein
MPINLAQYIDTPGAPRRTVYPDFTIGESAVIGLDAGLTQNVAHGCGLPVVFPAGLEFWYIQDKPVISWIIIAVDGIGAVHSYGNLLIRTGRTTVIMNDWRIFPLNYGLNLMEGLFISAGVCLFRIISSVDGAGFTWSFKAQGL